MTERHHPMPGNVLIKAPRVDDEYGQGDAETEVGDLDGANLITSMVLNRETGLHRPVIDIDFPAAVALSSTPGHSHLFIDRQMVWPRYVALLEALAAVGIVEPGYVRASKARGYSAVRLPWVRKPEPAKPAIQVAAGASLTELHRIVARLANVRPYPGDPVPAPPVTPWGDPF